MLRHALIALFALAGAIPAAELTLVLDFEAPHSDTTLSEMRRELNKVLEPARMNVDLKLRADIYEGQEFRDLVMVRMKGTCRMIDYAPLMDERGPFAWTQTVNGVVLPFSEVACDKVRRSLDRVLVGQKPPERERMLGRALGRILAHELFHIFTRSGDHGREGVARAAFNARQLVADRMTFDLHDLARMAP